MRWKFRTVFFILLLSVAATGQQTSPAKGTAAAAKDGTLSGKQLYVADCALCHGGDAKGGGPFSPQLKTWPPDLTQLAKKNHGVYPAMHVSEVIDGEFEKPAHGSREMPIWGPVFRSLAHGHNDSAQLRINRLVKYLESLQQK
ncbi:MAG: cytochrome c [Terriglobales bacterium]